VNRTTILIAALAATVSSAYAQTPVERGNYLINGLTLLKGPMGFALYAMAETDQNAIVAYLRTVPAKE